MKNLTLNESIEKQYFGEVELIFKDRHGKIICTRREPNIVKIFAKESISHTLPFSKIWDPLAGTGSGAWVDSDVDPTEEFALKYILIGASFDENGIPLDTQDPRYYVRDEVTGLYVPVRLEPGAHYDGGLINAIPLSEPERPLKRIEKIYFEPTYQPSGTPLLQDDVRAINNVLVVETTIKSDEYNGFGLTDSDYFTITEVALAAGKTINSVDQCDCNPRQLFLDGPYEATASGGDVVSLDNVADVGSIRAGDQIKITGSDGSAGYDDLDQVSTFYLVMSKAGSGKDLVLDRIPTNDQGTPIVGPINVWRDTLRIFSHRILTTPAKKSSTFELLVRWRIIIN